MKEQRMNRAARRNDRHVALLVMSVVAFAAVAAAVVMIVSMNMREPVGGGATAVPQERRLLSAVEPHSRYTQDDSAARAMSEVAISSLILLALLAAAMSSCGLVSYRIVARGSELAIRRAVGATRSDIRRHVLLEGCVITLIGVAVGAILATIGSDWLASAYSMPPVPLVHVAGAALLLSTLGILIAFIYARRAACSVPTNTSRAP